MATSFKQSMRLTLLFTSGAAALAIFPLTAQAGSGFRRAIDAGVAGAVAGNVAGEALTGTMPPSVYHPAPYPAPVPNCADELFQERGAYTYWIGQRRVCH